MSQIEITANVSSPTVVDTMARDGSVSSGVTGAATPHGEVPSIRGKLRHQPVPQLVDQVNDHIRSLGTKVRFTVDGRTGKQIVIVAEKETGKVIRQIPPEEMLELAAKMKELVGIIYNGKA